MTVAQQSPLVCKLQHFTFNEADDYAITIAPSDKKRQLYPLIKYTIIDSIVADNLRPFLRCIQVLNYFSHENRYKDQNAENL